MTVPENWAQYYDDVVDRHGPLLRAAVGQCLTAIWTPTRGLLGRRSERAWGSHAPILFVFEDLQLEFAWHLESRSVTSAGVDAAGERREGWCQLGADPRDPAELTALAGQRLWAVDVLEVDGETLDLGFAFSRSYLAMTSSCCCTLILSCGPRQRRRLPLAAAGPTRDGYPPQAVAVPRGRPAWPPHDTDPSLVWTGRGGSEPHS